MTTQQRLKTTERIDFNSIKYEQLSSIIDKLTEAKEKYGDIELDFSYDDDDLDIYLIYERDETDEEMQSRLNYDKQIKEYRRQQYELLKKEFESEQ